MRKFLLVAALLAAPVQPALCDSYDELSAGIQFFIMSQWSDVVIHMDKALAAGDLVPSLQYVAYLDRARAHLLLGHKDLAIADYSASLAIHPANPVSLLQRTLAYLAADKLDLAVNDLDALIAVRPQGDLYRLRAEVNLRRGKTDRTLEDYRTILAMLPAKAPQSFAAGLLYWQVGKVTEAADNFAAASQKCPKPVYAWLWLALADIQQDKTVPRQQLPDTDRKVWPGPLVSFFLGESPQPDVFTAAEEGDKVSDQRCEANFYVGEWLLQHKDSAAAKPLLAKAASECPQGFVEWGPAHIAMAGLP